MFLLAFTSPVMAVQDSISASDGDVPAEAVEAEDGSLVPEVLKDLDNVPDIDKVAEIANEEAAEAGWGTYGGIIVLLIAAFLGLLKTRKKKKF